MTESKAAAAALDDEFKRQRRLVDQMTSMHSMLRDRYRRQATAMTSTILILSVVAVAFAFAPSEPTLVLMGLAAQRSTWLGWFAVVVFCLTLVDLVVDWRGRAGQHDDAVRQLGSLKKEYRTGPLPGQTQATVARLSEAYESVMSGLPPIPERRFNALKARHLRKVEVSRYLSAHPGCSVVVATWRVRRGAVK